MDIKKYIISNIEMRDQWSSTYGPMQDYMISLEGEEGWIKLTQKLDTRPPQRGDELEGYIETKSNTNGEAYRKFKKQSAQYGANRSEGQSSQANHKEDYIIQMLEELTGRREVVDRAEEKIEPMDDPFGDI